MNMFIACAVRASNGRSSALHTPVRQRHRVRETLPSADNENGRSYGRP